MLFSHENEKHLLESVESIQMGIHIELLGRCVAIWLLVHVKGDHAQMLSGMNVNSLPKTFKKKIFGNA